MKERRGERVQSAARCLCSYLIRSTSQSEVSFSHLLQDWLSVYMRVCAFDCFGLDAPSMCTQL